MTIVERALELVPNDLRLGLGSGIAITFDCLLKDGADTTSTDPVQLEH